MNAPDPWPASFNPWQSFQWIFFPHILSKLLWVYLRWFLIASMMEGSALSASLWWHRPGRVSGMPEGHAAIQQDLDHWRNILAGTSTRSAKTSVKSNTGTVLMLGTSACWLVTSWNAVLWERSWRSCWTPSWIWAINVPLQHSRVIMSWAASGGLLLARATMATKMRGSFCSPQPWWDQDCCGQVWSSPARREMRKPNQGPPVLIKALEPLCWRKAESWNCLAILKLQKTTFYNYRLHVLCFGQHALVSLRMF